MGKLISPQESIHFASSQAECQASWKVNKLLQTFYGMPIAKLEPWRKIYPHIAVSVLAQPAADPSDPGWNYWELCLLLSDACVTVVRSTTHQHRVISPRFQLLPPSLLEDYLQLVKGHGLRFLFPPVVLDVKLEVIVGGHQKWDNIKEAGLICQPYSWCLLIICICKWMLRMQRLLGLIHLYRHSARYTVAHQ